MPKSQESKLRDSRRHTAISCFIFPIVTVESNILYTTVYIRTEAKKLQVLCSRLSVPLSFSFATILPKSHCSEKSVRRRLWSKKKRLSIFYEAKKSVRRRLWSKKKRLSIFYEARKSVRRRLWSKKKRLSTNFTKSVRRWPKKCLSIFEKKSVCRPFTT